MRTLRRREHEWIHSHHPTTPALTPPPHGTPLPSHRYAAWESKIYVLLCGGLGGLTIRTTNKIVLSLGIEVTVDDFFDSHYLVRNLASLFGIPTGRMRVPRIVPGSTVVDVEMLAADLCAPERVPSCGPHGHCFDGNCVCEPGWQTPDGCVAHSDCECSHGWGG